jgi:hypothetical protein
MAKLNLAENLPVMRCGVAGVSSLTSYRYFCGCVFMIELFRATPAKLTRQGCVFFNYWSIVVDYVTTLYKISNAWVWFHFRFHWSPHIDCSIALTLFTRVGLCGASRNSESSVENIQWR